MIIQKNHPAVFQNQSIKGALKISTQKFPYEFSKIFKNIFFYKTPLVVASCFRLDFHQGEIPHQTETNNRGLKPMFSENHENWHRGSYCKDKEKSQI